MMECEKGTEHSIDLTLFPIITVLVSADIGGLLSRKSMYVLQTFWGGFCTRTSPSTGEKTWQKVYVYILKILNSYPLMKIDNTEVISPNIGSIFTVQNPANPYAERIAGTVKKLAKTSV